MSDLTVSTTVDGVKREVTVDFVRPETLADACERWQEKPVYDCFIDRLDVKVQDNIRNNVLKSDTYNPDTAQADAQAVANDFDLAAKRTRQARMPEADAYVQFLQAKAAAGTITEKEAKMLSSVDPDFKQTSE